MLQHRLEWHCATPVFLLRLPMFDNQPHEKEEWFISLLIKVVSYIIVFILFFSIFLGIIRYTSSLYAKDNNCQITKT